MIGWIARRELLEHVRSARFLVLSLLCVLLLPAATYVNVTALRARELFAQELDETRIVGGEGHTALNDQGASRFGWRSGIVAADPALRAIRHPDPAELLAAGVSGGMPAFWQFSTEGVAEGAPALVEEGVSGGAGATDVASLVQAVLGLLALLMAFDSVSGELESGRLRTILAHPVSRAEVLAGKFVGTYGSLVMPLFVGVSAAYLVMWLRGMPVFEGSYLGAAAGVLIASLLYLATMLALGIAVSALTREARTSLVVLLVAWICITLGVASAAKLASAAMSPVQPIELMRASIAASMRQLERERAQRLAEVWQSVSGSQEVPHDGVVAPELRSRYIAAIGAIEQAMTARKRQIIEGHQGARQRQVDRQLSLQWAIGRLSPAVTYMRGAEALAGTGTAMREAWRREIQTAQHALEAASFDRRFGMELYAADLDYLRITYWPNNEDDAERVPRYDELPVFTHHRPPSAQVFISAAPELCLLAVECVGLLTVAAVAYARIDV